MRIYVASDHAGFALKEEVKEALPSLLDIPMHDVIDLGASSLVPGDSYVPYMKLAAESVQADAFHDPSIAILFGGSGTGEAIVANRYAHVRAFPYIGGSDECLMLARQHNDANVLSLGARFISLTDALHAIDLFYHTAFSHDERHSERIISIDSTDSEYSGD